jgi:hypothetical protein
LPEIKGLDREELARKGEQVYSKIRERLEAERPGQFVAIEVESGDYFLGETIQEADEKASAKYPHGVFYIVRIGRRAAWVRR